MGGVGGRAGIDRGKRETCRIEMELCLYRHDNLSCLTPSTLCSVRLLEQQNGLKCCGLLHNDTACGAGPCSADSHAKSETKASTQFALWDSCKQSRRQRYHVTHVHPHTSTYISNDYCNPIRSSNSLQTTLKQFWLEATPSVLHTSSLSFGSGYRHLSHTGLYIISKWLPQTRKALKGSMS